MYTIDHSPHITVRHYRLLKPSSCEAQLISMSFLCTNQMLPPEVKIKIANTGTAEWVTLELLYNSINHQNISAWIFSHTIIRVDKTEIDVIQGSSTCSPSLPGTVLCQQNVFLHNHDSFPSHQAPEKPVIPEENAEEKASHSMKVPPGFINKYFD